MGKIADMEFLKAQLVVLGKQRKELQDAIAKLPELEAEIQAISFVIAKYSGEQHRVLIAPQGTRSGSLVGSEPSISKLILRALTEAGKPQRGEQLLAFLASHGKPTASATLRSTIHQSKLFKSVTPGVYGLVEWQQ